MALVIYALSERLSYDINAPQKLKRSRLQREHLLDAFRQNTITLAVRPLSV